MTIPFTPPIADPNLKDLIDQHKKDIFLSLNCHAIGTVKNFDSDTQPIDCVINYTRTFYKKNDANNFSPVQVAYPILLNCPVFILSGGGAAITMPITIGDQVLLLFNDRDIDNWWSGATTGPVNTGRLHSMSDAIALIGLFPLNKSISDYDGTRAVIRNGEAEVGVGTTKVLVSNNDTTLNTLLQSLVTDIRSLITQIALITVTGVTTGGGVSGPPANAAAITAISTTLGTLATEIGGLLE